MEYEEIIHRCFRCGYCKLTEDYLALITEQQRGAYSYKALFV